MRLIDADKLKKDLESVTLSNGTLLNTNAVLLLLINTQHLMMWIRSWKNWMK